MAVLHWVIQLNNDWGMVRESISTSNNSSFGEESNNLMVNQNSPASYSSSAELFVRPREGVPIPFEFHQSKGFNGFIEFHAESGCWKTLYFIRITKRRKLVDSRTHSPSATLTTLDPPPGTYDRFRVGRAFVSAAFVLSPSYQQPAGGSGVLQETYGSQLFSRFSRRCAADWVQDTTIVRTVCYQVNGGLWLEPITNCYGTSAGRRMRAPVVAVLNERRVCLPRPGNLKGGPDLRFSTFEPTVLLVTHSK